MTPLPEMLRRAVAGWVCCGFASALAAAPIGTEAHDATPLTARARESGLAFTGPDAISLTFEKPSDIITEVSKKFPAAMAQARQSGSFSGELYLQGAYEPWGPEPAAFISLWKCMPKSAWLQPQQNPFARQFNDGGRLLWPIAAMQSSYKESDFGFCVDNRAGFAAAATPVLQAKFAALLNRQTCSGTGPDDCVLVMRLWASLSPDDPGLAVAILRLEHDVMDRPLPELRNPSANWMGVNFADGQARFDEALRRAAFLRAKLLSVLHAPSAWPSGALPRTLRQMSELRGVFAGVYVTRFYVYQLDHRNDPINPWHVLDDTPDSDGRVGYAILPELRRLAEDPATDCAVFAQWFLHSNQFPHTEGNLRRPDPLLQSRYVLAQWRDRRPARCAAPDYEWLRQQTDTDARYVLYGYLALLDGLPADERRDVMDGLTNHGAACTGEAARSGWLEQTCAKRETAAGKKSAHSMRSRP